MMMSLQLNFTGRAGPARIHRLCSLLKGPPLGSQSGFTLLEVMASLAILGIGVMMVIQLFSGGLLLAGRSRDHAGLALLAREKMTEAFLDSALKEGASSGSEDGIEWKVEVSPFDAADMETGPNVRILKVTASVKGAGRSASGFTLTALKTAGE